MKRCVLLVLVLALAVPCLAFGQAQTAPAKPSPEVQRLGYYTGSWKYAAEVAADPKAKPEGTFDCQWLAGGFSVMCREESMGPGGKFSDVRLMTYDPTEKVYTHYMVMSTGPGGSMSKGTVSGSTWLWQWDSTQAGKPAKGRMTIVEVSPTSYTSKVEMSLAGGPWAVVSEARGTKIK